MASPGGSVAAVEQGGRERRNPINRTYIRQLQELGACEDALARCESYPTLEKAWQACQRGDWMLWLVGRLAGPPGDDSRRPLVLATCECARLALPYVPAGEERPRLVIEAAEDWARGGKTTLAKVRRAAAAAAAPLYALYSVFYISYLSAIAAAPKAAIAAFTADAVNAFYAVQDAADAVDAADASNTAGTLTVCADIVRKHYPHAPELKHKYGRRKEANGGHQP